MLFIFLKKKRRKKEKTDAELGLMNTTVDRT